MEQLDYNAFAQANELRYLEYQAKTPLTKHVFFILAELAFARATGLAFVRTEDDRPCRRS